MSCHFPPLILHSFLYLSQCPFNCLSCLAENKIEILESFVELTLCHSQPVLPPELATLAHDPDVFVPDRDDYDPDVKINVIPMSSSLIEMIRGVYGFLRVPKHNF